jgi:hypothetical protein
MDRTERDVGNVAASPPRLAPSPSPWLVQVCCCPRSVSPVPPASDDGPDHRSAAANYDGCNYAHEQKGGAGTVVVHAAPHLLVRWVVGEVAPKLTLASVMVGPSWCLAGRSALPLEPGDGGHRGMPQDRQGQATEPTKSAMHELAGRGRLRSRVGRRGACGWGLGMPAPSGQIPPPGCGRRTRPPTRAACRPVPGRDGERLAGCGRSMDSARCLGGCHP